MEQPPRRRAKEEVEPGDIRLGELMVAIRKGEKQDVTAKTIGIHPDKLRRFEHGTLMPTLRELSRWANALSLEDARWNEVFKIFYVANIPKRQVSEEELVLARLNQGYDEKFHVELLPKNPRLFTQYFERLGHLVPNSLVGYRSILDEGLRIFPSAKNREYLFSIFGKSVLSWARNFKREELSKASYFCTNAVSEILDTWQRARLPQEASYWELRSEIAQLKGEDLEARHALQQTISFAESTKASPNYLQALYRRLRQINRRIDSRALNPRGSIDDKWRQVERYLADGKWDMALKRAENAHHRAIAVQSFGAIARSHAYLGFVYSKHPDFCHRANFQEESRKHFEMARFLAPRDLLLNDLEESGSFAK